jgi:NAD(P)-dependent dehydrogenase (short-subunit alcohol dehydrogenase family)
LHEIATAEFDKVVATNLRGSFLCLKHQMPALLEAGGGSVVFTSSLAGISGARGVSAYSASKFALTGLIRSAALEYAADGVRVNGIAPGPTHSTMFDTWLPTEEARAERMARFPIKEVADPDIMARAALFLLSDESRWTTGVVLPCDAGFTAG